MAPTISVAVVDAATSGNVGTIARAMKNFVVEQLLLVNPPPVGPGTEAHGFAGRARHDILPNAREVTFEYIVSNYHTIGFTSETNPTDTKGIRHPAKTPAQLAEAMEDVESDTALVFGRERTGLRNEELAQLDEIATIPASSAYPVLNLGQAATIALYEFRRITLAESQLPSDRLERAEEAEIEALYDHIDAFLDRIEYTPERRGKAGVMLRRLLGRAHPTTREVATLHGIMRETEQAVEKRG